MLEEVGVHPLLVHLNVRLDVISENLHVQLYTLLGELWLHEFQDLGMGNRGCGYGELFGSNGAGESGCGSQCCECFLQIHRSILLLSILNE